MPAPISIIIPTLNSEAGLAGCVSAIYLGLERGLIRELIFSDGGSTDATLKIADEIGAQVISGPPSRGGQIARAFEQAGGDWVMVLHSDTQLPENWCDLVELHLDRFPKKAGYFDLGFDQGGFGGKWVARWANIRSRLFQLPYGDQGILVHRDLMAKTGGYPNIPLMEDVALARALRGSLRPLGGAVRTSPAKYQRKGWLRQGMRNLFLLLRYLMGTSPSDLYEKYYKS